MKYRAQGAKEIGEAVLTAALCALVTAAVEIGAQRWQAAQEAREKADRKARKAQEHKS
jgi:hypothetical protein